MDAEQIFNALPMINHLSTIAAIGCVFPTYFLHLRPATYRLILCVGIVFGLLTLAIGVMVAFVGPLDEFAVYCSRYTCVVLAVRRRPDRNSCGDQAGLSRRLVEHGCLDVRHFRLGGSLCLLLGSLVNICSLT